MSVKMPVFHVNIFAVENERGSQGERVCVCKRERESQTDRQRQREMGGERDCTSLNSFCRYKTRVYLDYYGRCAHRC